jgi:hypothetical protein
MLSDVLLVMIPFRIAGIGRVIGDGSSLQVQELIFEVDSQDIRIQDQGKDTPED